VRPALAHPGAEEADSRRQALAGDRDRAIARTEVIEVDLI